MNSSHNPKRWLREAAVISGFGLALCWASLPAYTASPQEGAQRNAANGGGDLPAGSHPFHANVKVTMCDDAMVVQSDGIPTHKTGTYPNATNPNRILKQNYRFFIPLHPEKAKKTTPTPFGPIGVALNGIPFYNPYNREGRDAVFGPFAEIFDSCCGHPDQAGRYHYHKYPVCVKSPFKDPKGAHSPLIGYAFDGFALYGPNGNDGTPPTDLDECNGHDDAERGYHYHVTEKFPYLVGAYRGTPDPRNMIGPVRGGRGGSRGMRPGGPPPHPLQMALDTDRDGTISATEIKHAAQSLKMLDRDNDGALSREELRPPGMPPGGRPPGGPGADGPPPDGPPPDGAPPFGPPPGGFDGPPGEG